MHGQILQKKGAPIIENANVQWERYESSKQAFMVLDNLSQLRLMSDKKDINDILNFADSSVATELEKCILVRETLINIGDPDFKALKNWNNGACNKFDLEEELLKIEESLVQEYGKVSIF